MATAITIGIVVLVILNCAAATTDAVLPATNSANPAVWMHHCCRRVVIVTVWMHHRCHRVVDDGVAIVVINSDAIRVDATEAPPILPSGMMDPTVSVVASATEEEEYNGCDGADP